MAAVSSDDEQMEEEAGRIYSNEEDDVAQDPGNFQGSGGHQCNICGKMFCSTKGLVQHSIIHTDRKPFECEICHKAFRFKSNLFEHRSLHSGEQPYVCPFCGKACRLKGNLKKHLKTHCRDPNEIEQAYEAVTNSHVSNNISSADAGDLSANTPAANTDYDVYEDYQRSAAAARPSTVAKPKKRSISTPKRMPIKREDISGPAATILYKVLQDENNEPMVEGNAAYPPLSEMFGYSTEDFIRAARIMPYEKYRCRSCQITFNTRYDMEDHCESMHEISRRLTKSNQTNPVYWCDTCLRDFDDQKTYDQHFFFHRRIRALVNKGELRIKDPEVRTFF